MLQSSHATILCFIFHISQVYNTVVYSVQNVSNESFGSREKLSLLVLKNKINTLHVPYSVIVTVSQIVCGKRIILPFLQKTEYFIHYSRYGIIHVTNN
jgi:hypothetical protein